MLKQSDLQGRLRLLRYGLLVVVIVTFVVTLAYPVVFLGPNAIGQFIGQSLLFTVIVAVICVGIYLGYDRVLHRTMGPSAGDTSQAEKK